LLSNPTDSGDTFLMEVMFKSFLNFFV